MAAASRPRSPSIRPTGSRCIAESATPRAALNKPTDPCFLREGPGKAPGLFFAIVGAEKSLKSSSPTAVRLSAGVSGAIGGTPLVELSRFARGAGKIFAKLEWLNPGGSLKDRIALALIEDA